jgi:hypothetical protein
MGYKQRSGLHTLTRQKKMKIKGTVSRDGFGFGWQVPVWVELTMHVIKTQIHLVKQTL